MPNEPCLVRNEGTYGVLWIIGCTGTQASTYGHAITRSWRTSPWPAGESRMTCDHVANRVVAKLDLVADDVVHALSASQRFVFGPLERAGLPLPEEIVIAASKRPAG